MDNVRAACRDKDLSLWFPEARKGGNGYYREARAVCLTCPVRPECLAEALSEEKGTNYRFGMRGGMTPAERDHLMAGRRIAMRSKTLLDVSLSGDTARRFESCAQQLGLAFPRSITTCFT